MATTVFQLHIVCPVMVKTAAVNFADSHAESWGAYSSHGYQIPIGDDDMSVFGFIVKQQIMWCPLEVNWSKCKMKLILSSAPYISACNSKQLFLFVDWLTLWNCTYTDIVFFLPHTFNSTHTQYWASICDIVLNPPAGCCPQLTLHTAFFTFSSKQQVTLPKSSWTCRESNLFA